MIEIADHHLFCVVPQTSVCGYWKGLNYFLVYEVCFSLMCVRCTWGFLYMFAAIDFKTVSLFCKVSVWSQNGAPCCTHSVCIKWILLLYLFTVRLQWYNKNSFKHTLHYIIIHQILRCLNDRVVILRSLITYTVSSFGSFSSWFQIG